MIFHSLLSADKCCCEGEQGIIMGCNILIIFLDEFKWCTIHHHDVDELSVRRGGRNGPDNHEDLKHHDVVYPTAMW